ncbi:MAG TPA: OsmC family peroxiredoxin [Gaiellaceae bacterium]|jgi:lipoyl-dependent peroxiredoxin
MATNKTARATWEGTLAEGKGAIDFGSGLVSGLGVTWKDRAEGGEGTSPEELIAAAHASCILMALAGGLAREDTPPTRLDSEATTTFDKVGEGFAITKIELKIRGRVEGIDQDAFRQAAEGAKENCPVSQALKGNVEVTLDAALS